MTVPVRAPAPAPVHQAPAAQSFIRPVLGLLAGLGVTMLLVGVAVIVATLAALRGVTPAQFVPSGGYLAVVTVINLVGAVAGGITTARITAGRSFYTVVLLAVVLAMSGVAHALKDAPKPGEGAWFPWTLALLGAVGALAGGALERRRRSGLPTG